MIVVANKVDDLDKLKKSIEKKYGKYNNVPYITLLQSWNKNIKCLDEEVPVLNYADSKNRCNQSCQYKECPLVKQYTEIDYSPILAVTTERFSSMSKGRNIDKYKIFHNGSKKREYIIIDEKPVILSNKSISLADINILKSQQEEVNATLANSAESFNTLLQNLNEFLRVPSFREYRARDAVEGSIKREGEAELNFLIRLANRYYLL